MTHLESDEFKPKKRQRMSVVCLNCKARKIKCDKKRPSCTNCVKCNVGHLCRYEEPHWVNKVINSDGQTKVENGQSEQQTTHLRSQISPNAPVISPPRDSEVALQEEIKKLRSRLESIEGTLLQSTAEHHTKTSANRREYEDDLIDFYGSYNSLTIKSSCMEDHKPLSSSAIVKKDHYLALLSGYFFLCHVLKGVSRNHKKEVARNKRLDSSLALCVELLGENESPFMKTIISKFVEERFNSEDPKNAIFTLTSLTNISKPLFINELKSDIERILPPKPIISLYLDRFFKYIYPFFPSIDQSFYRGRMIQTILKTANKDDQNSPVVLNFEDKFDFAFIATLLILLRWTYTAMGIPKTEADSKLIEHPIPASYITAAQTALSQFKIMRKTKLHIVHSLFYLRMYFYFAPEDGDGPDLNQSQILSSTIIQSAFSMGLNRDAERYSHFNEYQGYVNVWRKLWLSILEMDRVSSVLSGQSCVIQNTNSYEVQFPELTKQDNSLEHVTVKSMKNDQRLHRLFLELTNLVNNVGPTTRVSDVVGVLKQMHTYVNLNYSLKKLIPLTKGNEDEANFMNVKTVKQNIIIRSLSLSVYQSLVIHYESDEHYELQKYQHFQSLVMETAIELADIITRYLGDEYTDYIDSNYHFYLNRLVENSTSRVITCFISILARLYHTKDTLIMEFNTTDTSTIRSINDLTSVIFRVTNALNILSQNKLGRTYYSAFKSSLMNKFFLRSLKKDGFKCIKETVNFLGDPKAIDPTVSCEKSKIKAKMFQKMEYEQGFSTDALDKLNKTNPFIDYNVQDFKNLLKVVESSHILKRDDLSSEKLLWGYSFATGSTIDASTSVSINSNLNNYTMNQDDNGYNVGSGTSLSPDSFTDMDPNISLLNLDQLLNDDLLAFGSLKSSGNNSIDDVNNLFRL